MAVFSAFFKALFKLIYIRWQFSVPDFSGTHSIDENNTVKNKVHLIDKNIAIHEKQEDIISVIFCLCQTDVKVT